MSYLDDASLVMIPSGYKDGKLYSIKPTDGTGDFTFTRGSNLAATRVDENGLIEKGRENLLLQSNQFDTTWTTSSASVTGGQSGYDGTNNAWLLSKSAANGRVQQSLTTSAVNTFSVYAKAGTKNWLATAHPTSGAYFNLSNGTTGTIIGSNVIESKIEDVGNGWYKCIVVHNSSTTQMQIYVADSNGDVSQASGSIYIQDAQLEQGLVATDYIETGATTAQAGILEDMPRLDYSGGTCPALLLEPQRTNLITNSEYFDAWTKQYITLDANNSVSPDGTQNATLIESTTTESSYISDSTASVTIGNTYTFSVFAKKGNNNWIRIAHITSAATAAWFDLENGVVGTVNSISATIEDYGNGWYRCTNTFVATHSSGLLTFVGICDNNNSTGAGAIGQNDYIWGWQLEQGSYPTSYIPTYGTSVTRGVDFAEATFAENDIAPTGGTTLFIEFETSGEVDTTPNTGGFSFKNNAGTLPYLGISFGYGDKIYSNYVNGSTVVWDAATAENTLCKVAFQLVNGGKSFLNGTTKATTSVDWSTKPLGQFELQYGTKVKQAVVFPTILTDADCIALTTL